MTNALADRLQYLEEKFAFQERTVDALNDVILDQQTQINELEEQLLKLKSLLTSHHQMTSAEKDPPPPHY